MYQYVNGQKEKYIPVSSHQVREQYDKQPVQPVQFIPEQRTCPTWVLQMLGVIVVLAAVWLIYSVCNNSKKSRKNQRDFGFKFY